MKKMLTVAAMSLAQAAMALDCPEPPLQTRKDWDVAVRAEVGRIGVVRGAELDTKVRSVTQDLMGKLPNADKLYLEQMMFAAYCSGLRDDMAMTGADKARQILEYRRSLNGAIQSLPVKDTRPDR